MKFSKIPKEKKLKIFDKIFFTKMNEFNEILVNRFRI